MVESTRIAPAKAETTGSRLTSIRGAASRQDGATVGCSRGAGVAPATVRPASVAAGASG